MTNQKHSENNQDRRMVQPRKPKRKSVQFGRVSYSDDPATTKELKSCKQERRETQFKRVTRSAMTSSKQDTSCIPPTPPQRQLSDEVLDLDEADFARSSSDISMNCLLESLPSMGEDYEEENEDEDDSSYSHGSQKKSNVSSYPYETFAPSLSKRRPSYLGVSPCPAH